VIGVNTAIYSLSGGHVRPFQPSPLPPGEGPHELRLPHISFAVSAISSGPRNLQTRRAAANSDAAVRLYDGGEAPLSVESEFFYAPHVIVDADTGKSVAANKVTETWDESEAAATALPLRSQVPPSETPNVQGGWADYLISRPWDGLVMYSLNKCKSRADTDSCE